MSARPSSSDMKNIPPEVSQYIQSVRNALSDNEFHDFLRSMHLFKHNMISFDFLAARVETKFKNHPQLICGFNAFIPGPHAVEDEKQRVGKFANFIQTLKDRFAHDLQVFNLFLGIIRRCRPTEGMSVHEARLEVKELIKDHPDLLEQFDQVLPGERVATGYPRRQWYDKLRVIPCARAAVIGYGNKREQTSDLRPKRNFKDGDLELVDHRKRGQSENDWIEHGNRIKRERKRSRKSEDPVFVQLHQGGKSGENFKLHDVSRYSCSNKNNSKGLYTQEDSSCNKVERQRQGYSEKERDKEKKRLDGSCSSVLKHAPSRVTERVDYSECQRENPSYCFRPKNNSTLLASGALTGDASVLNDILVSMPSGRGRTYIKQKNQYEEMLFRCEDDRYEMDMLLESVKSTAGRVEDFLNKIKDQSIEPDEIEVAKYFNSSNLRCIEVLYDEHGQSVMDMLRKSARLVLPVILARLKQKIVEFSSSYSTFDKVWTEIFSDNYHKSLGHDGLSFKPQDTINSESDIKSDNATLADLHESIEAQKQNENACMESETNEPSD